MRFNLSRAVLIRDDSDIKKLETMRHQPKAHQVKGCGSSGIWLESERILRTMSGWGKRRQPHSYSTIVSHDVRKFFGLLLKKNGHVLEQLYSPLVVQTTPEGILLKPITGAAIKRARGILKKKPGGKPFREWWTEYKKKEKA